MRTQLIFLALEYHVQMGKRRLQGLEGHCFLAVFLIAFLGYLGSNGPQK
jgi:hypothetical protein